jgi:hypothetical protein
MPWNPRQNRLITILWGLLIASVVGLALTSFLSCATYEVVQEAPADFWLTLEKLVLALANDIWSVVTLFM